MKHTKGLRSTVGNEAVSGAKTSFGVGAALATVLSGAAIAVMPAAGEFISNQAIATYTDSTGTPQTTDSNVVTTEVGQVADVDIADDYDDVGSPGSVVALPFVVTNLGNDEDVLNISFAENAADDFDCDTVALYDADPAQLSDPIGDPIFTSPPDSATNVSLGAFAMQESRNYVWLCEVPDSSVVTEGDVNSVDITVASGNNPANTDVVTHTVNVSNTVVDVQKSFVVPNDDSNSPQINGPADGDGDDNLVAGETGVGVRIFWRNTGTEDTNIFIEDVLPSGMSYVAGSARYLTWGGTALTDVSGGDPANVDFEFDDTVAGSSEGRIRITLSNVPAAATGVTAGSGNIYFQVTIDSNDDPAVTNVALQETGDIVNAGDQQNTAGYNTTGFGNPYTDSDAVFTVEETSVVELEDDYPDGTQPNIPDVNGNNICEDDVAGDDTVTVAEGAAGQSVYFCNVVNNIGNTDENVTITLDEAASTFPENTVFALQQDGFSGLTDGTIFVAAGESRVVVVKATLPADAPAGDNGGAGYSITKTATIDTATGTQSDSDVDLLENIVANSVDLTNNGPVTAVADGTDTCTGLCDDDDIANPAVDTESVDPGQTAYFSLWVNVDDDSPAGGVFNLLAATDDAFTVGLPDGWEVIYTLGDGVANGSVVGVPASDLGGAQVTQVTVQPGESVEVIAQITIPAIGQPGANTPADSTDVYFRVLDASGNGTVDAKKDRVNVNEVRLITLEESGEKTVVGGGCAVYEHVVTNLGNVTEGNGAPNSNIGLTLVDDNTSLTTFTESTLYIDDNDNASSGSPDGELTIGSDTELNAAGATSVNLPVALGSNESALLFVRTCGVTGGAVGSENVATLTATPDDTGATAYEVGTTTPAAVNNEDRTTLVGVELTKRHQVVDTATTGQIPVGGSNGGEACNAPVAANWTADEITAIPSQCVCYQVVAVNNESGPISDLFITDTVPDFTTLDTCGTACTPDAVASSGSAVAVNHGGEGAAQGTAVTATLPAMQQNESVTLEFCVEIDRY